MNLQPPRRSRFQGVSSIVRFNLPVFITAAAAILVSIIFIPFSSGILRQLAIVALAISAASLLAALAASWIIYDLSPLYRWTWLTPHLGKIPSGHATICHTGFDEISDSLRHHFPHLDWQVIDHFDPSIMTEPSIRRARRFYPPRPGTLTAPFDQWNHLPSPSILILAVLAIHELRSEEERILWFREAHAHLLPGGSLVVVEHLRDLPNFLVFGPGFLHFHSTASWERCWQAAGFTLVSRRPITPWLACFILKSS